MPTLGPGVGNVITANTTGDFNTIQGIVAKVLGAPTDSDPRYGYNQVLSSGQVSVGNKVTLTQWTNLRSDMIRARGHQTGNGAESNNVTLPTTSSLITEALRQSYLTYANILTTYRDTIASNQYTQETINTAIRTSAWNGNISSTVSLNFGDLPSARAFFNAGGLIKLAASLTGSFGVAATVKDNTWATMFAQSGTITLGPTSTYLAQGSSGTPSSGIGYFNLNGSYQTIFLKSAPSGSYSANEFRILAKYAGTSLDIQFQYNDVSGQPNVPWGEDERVDGILTQTTVLWRPTGTYVALSQPGITLSGDLQNGAGAVYGLLADKYVVDEGGTVTLTLKTQNVSDGTVVTYSVSGVAVGRFSSGQLSGYFTVYSNSASVSWTIANNLFTDGTTTFTVSLNNGLASQTITINDTSKTPVGERSFTNSGQFTWLAPSGVLNVSVLVVAGGGGGGSFAGGGGGGGQTRVFSTPINPGQTYYLEVGYGGGSGGTGGNSNFSGNVAYGGNAGGNGSTGGHSAAHTGGTGGTSGNGNTGGSASGNTTSGGSNATNIQKAAGGGGGGTGGNGSNAQTQEQGGLGAIGLVYTINNWQYWVGGGGGGGGTNSGGTGRYGGGVGGQSDNVGGGGQANTGGGGGGGGAKPAGAQTVAQLEGKAGGQGGSGFVILAWT